MLQEKIDHLERLLAENNEIISNIRDSVINLSESVDDGSKSSQGNFSQGAGPHLLPPQLPLQSHPADCLFASRSGRQHPDVQVMYTKGDTGLVGVYSCLVNGFNSSPFVK